MKTAKGFRMRPLGNEFVLIAESLSLVNFNKMISLNSSAAFLWKKADEMESFEIEDLANALVEEYEIDKELALKDSASIVDKWIEAGIVEE